MNKSSALLLEGIVLLKVECLCSIHEEKRWEERYKSGVLNFMQVNIKKVPLAVYNSSFLSHLTQYNPDHKENLPGKVKYDKCVYIC